MAHRLLYIVHLDVNIELFGWAHMPLCILSFDSKLSLGGLNVVRLDKTFWSAYYSI